jgi:undecaprenyl diphosphate synthase
MNIGIIMDGNRRFAKNNLITTYQGHQNGFKKLLEVVEWSLESNITSLTVYALSTENFKKRSKTEINNILKILKLGIEKYSNTLIKNRIKVKFIGDLSIFENSFQSLLIDLEENTNNNEALNLNICLNYGARTEIINAIKKIEKINELTEEKFSESLLLKLEPDIIIRTGGDKRISNFLLWQSAYSEFFFLDCMWPEFSKEDFKSILNDYNIRDRRMGR